MSSSPKHIQDLLSNSAKQIRSQQEQQVSEQETKSVEQSVASHKSLDLSKCSEAEALQYVKKLPHFVNLSHLNLGKHIENSEIREEFVAQIPHLKKLCELKMDTSKMRGSQILPLIKKIVEMDGGKFTTLVLTGSLLGIDSKMNGFDTTDDDARIKYNADVIVKLVSLISKTAINLKLDKGMAVKLKNYVTIKARIYDSEQQIKEFKHQLMAVTNDDSDRSDDAKSKRSERSVGSRSSISYEEGSKEAGNAKKICANLAQKAMQEKMKELEVEQINVTDLPATIIHYMDAALERNSSKSGNYAPQSRNYLARVLDDRMLENFCKKFPLGIIQTENYNGIKALEDIELYLKDWTKHKDYIKKGSWLSSPPTVQKNVNRILEIIEKHPGYRLIKQQELPVEEQGSSGNLPKP